MRKTFTSMMINAHSQQNNLRTVDPICPSSKDDRFENEVKEVCATNEKAILSIDSTLKKDGIELENGEEVEILSDSSNIVKVKVLSSGNV
ncbi:MAG: hypothetical protein D3913_11785 [Candidatus Electrothrix sp. LOE1_4_5]|nr:hypothetical protein [Candidatus Electrothrix gigas]